MRILLAVDLSQDPWGVVDAVAPFARRLSATVDLVNVDEGYASTAVTEPELLAVLQRETDRRTVERAETLRRLADRLPEGCRGAVFAPVGPIARTVVDMAQNYDLLAVSTHGRTGLSHLWMGSIAEKLVRTSDRPVLVVRPHENA